MSTMTIYYLFLICLLLVLAFFWGGYFTKKHRHVESALLATNEQLIAILKHSSDAINITTVDGKLLYINTSFEKMYGWKKEELIGKPLPIIPDKLGEDEARRRELLLKGYTISNWEDKFLRKDGTFIDVNVSVFPLKDGDGVINGFAAITRDETKRKKVEQQLKQLVYNDPLTGAANRRSYYERLEFAITKAKKNKRKFALLYLDIDRFKWVNDTMGHDVGDQLLQQFVTCINSLLPTTCSLFRLGGDEFVIILTELSSTDAPVDFAKQLIELLQTPWCIQEHQFVTTSSIGISIYPEDGEDAQTLTSNADHALYQAKADGRNLIRFYEHQTVAETTA
ncbi:MAG: diguanylate cyclase [Bacillus sp. (in: Bacteria)]|nr:diguanylate cyclase [Bacillus sp. (in: firmicutes)]